jgi:hypothetical protein
MAPMTKKTIAAAGAAALLIGGGATAAGAAVTQQGTGGGPRVHDVDADLTRDGRVRLEAETARSADRVTFRYDGRTFRARVVDTDADDGTEDWASTVTAARADRDGGTRISVRVRACSEAGCTTRTVRERLEAPDDDD